MCRIRCQLFGVLCCLLSLGATTTVGAEPSRDDRAAILDVMENGPLMIGRNTQAWMDNFHPGWTVWFAGAPEVRLREAHMQDVLAYVERGAVVTAYDFTLVSLDVEGDQALIRYLARETIDDPDQGERIVQYSGVDQLVREDGRWLIFSSSLSFPAGYTPSDEE